MNLDTDLQRMYFVTENLVIYAFEEEERGAGESRPLFHISVGYSNIGWSSQQHRRMFERIGKCFKNSGIWLRIYLIAATHLF